MPDQSSREQELLTQTVVLQTKIYGARRALEAAERVLNRNDGEEGELFRDGGTLHQVKTALEMLSKN